MEGKTAEKLREEADAAWQQLQTQLHPDIVHAPRLDWSQVDPRIVLYLAREVQGKPWDNHLAFLAVILSSYTKHDRSTITGRIYRLHARLREIFPRYQISSLLDWDPREHLQRYMKDAELADEASKGNDFLYIYNGSVHHCNVYLHTLPKTEQDRYQQWILDFFPNSSG